MTNKRISKSQYTQGLQCVKSLWTPLAYNPSFEKMVVWGLGEYSVKDGKKLEALAERTEGPYGLLPAGYICHD